MAKGKLPKTVYAYMEPDTNSSDGKFLMAYDNERDCASLEEDRKVGRYELVEEFTLTTETVIKRK